MELTIRNLSKTSSGTERIEVVVDEEPPGLATLQEVDPTIWHCRFGDIR